MMDKRDLGETLLLAGFRLTGVIMVILGGLELLFNLLEVWYRFDPNYLGAFVMEALVRAGIVIAAGILLLLLARPLAGRLSARDGRAPSE